MNKAILKAINISKSVQSHNGVINILNGLSLSVRQCESIAVVGQSGSGKSTLLSLLAGLDTPQSGSIYINELEISSLNENQRADIRAQKTGFVFQSFYLMDDLNSIENIALPMEFFGHKTPEKTAAKWLRKLGLEHRAKHFPKQLSGGEQQRVALARAFALEPQILFADEPTANLDTNTAKIVIDHLFELHLKCRNSMILVTHDQNLANRCDTVYYLKDGKLQNV